MNVNEVDELKSVCLALNAQCLRAYNNNVFTCEEARFCRRHSILILDILRHIHHVASEAIDDENKPYRLPHIDAILRESLDSQEEILCSCSRRKGRKEEKKVDFD